MKVKIDGIKFKFKKINAPAMMLWLSGIVHILAAVNRNRTTSRIDTAPFDFEVPEDIQAFDCDIPLSFVEYTESDLPELKAARRKVAAIVRLERMQ